MLLGLTAEKTAAAGTMAGGKVSDALLVLDPQAERKLDVLRVPVQVDAVADRLSPGCRLGRASRPASSATCSPKPSARAGHGW